MESGRCPTHARDREHRRGSPTSRGYDSYWSRVFRPWFFNQLIAHGIAPVCGAALPGGPAMTDSRCRAAGLLNDKERELDHDPPLQPGEQRDRDTVCNPLRVGVLCKSCHSAKTQREQHAA